MRSSRWFVLALLFTARFVLGYQFQSAGSVASFLIRDFNISYAQIGMLVGLFMLRGLVVSIPSGLLGQRFGWLAPGGCFKFHCAKWSSASSLKRYWSRSPRLVV
jgi:MFS family permease